MRLSLRSLSTLALVGCVFAVPAFAQSNSGEGASVSQYAACSAKPSQAETEAAHGAYMAGKGSFDEADYTTAINYFKDAYRRDCTKHELLIIIARAYELQGNRREAVHALETYLERVPSAQDADVQRRHIANLKRDLVEQPAPPPSASASAAPVATPTVAPSASVAPAPLPTVSPSPSASSEPASPPSEVHRHTIYPWILVIGGGVAVGVAGALYGVGAGQVSNAEQVCGSSHVCPVSSAGVSAVSQGNSGRTEETVGVVVGGVGLAAVVAGIIWHFQEPTSADAAKAAGPTIAPAVGPGYAGMGVSGRF